MSDPVPEYVGRGWLVGVVREWAASASTYLFLTGEPGTGKSMAVERLWGGGPVAGTAVHRCRYSSRGSRDPVRFAESLAEQFSGTVPGYAEALARVARQLTGRSGDLRIDGTASAGTVRPGASLVGVRVTLSGVTGDEAFERLVAQPLVLLEPAERPVAVVDGLDEALTYDSRRTIAELVLGGTDGLPLRFVLTTRKDARITGALRSLPDAVIVDLVDNAPDPAADLLSYARHRLRGMRFGESEREELARALAADGKGNHLHIRHFTGRLARTRATAGASGSPSVRDLVEELEAGVREAQVGAGGATALPPLLEGQYRKFLQREVRPIGSAAAEERWRTAFRPVLALLSVAREDGFTAGQLAELLDCTEQEVLDAVRVLRQYLRGSDPRGPWTLYHRSFAEFLLGGDDPHIDAGEGHLRIADHAFAAWPPAWGSCDDPYLLRHLPDHLMAALDAAGGAPRPSRALQDRVYALATSPEYLAAQRADMPGRDPHLVTMQLALQASLAARAYPRAARLAVGLAGAREVARTVTPVRAALLGGAAEGVAKALAHPEGTALLWLLLIVAVLGDRSSADAADALRAIASGGFTRTEEDWAPAVAALLTGPCLRFTHEEFAPVLDVAGDELLSHLAAFLLEEAGPEAALEPALRIRETTARARAVSAILTQAALTALTGGDAGALDRLGTVIAARHLPEREGRHAWRSLLVTPDAADSALLAQAALGHLERSLAGLAVRSSLGTRGVSDDTVLLARIVQSARLGPNGVALARAAGEAAVAAATPVTAGEDIWVLLHHTALMVRVGDPTASALLDALVKESRRVEESPYPGHIDAFHGRCDIGLRLAVVRVLAEAGQTDRARLEAERLRVDGSTEHLRALAWAARSTPLPDGRRALAEAARVSAARLSHDLYAQAVMVLVDTDRARLVDATGRAAADGGHRPAAAGPARAALAWAAHVRGDHGRAEVLGTEAVARFTALPQERRTRLDADRLVKNLLRARLPALAVVAAGTATTDRTAAALLYLGDVRHSLAAHGEYEEVALLGEARGGLPDDPARRPSPYDRALAVTVLRAGGDHGAQEEACEALRDTVRGVLQRLAQWPEDSWLHLGKDEEAAVWCQLQAIRLPWPEAIRAASGELDMALNRAMFGAGSRDAFFGRHPREAENRADLDAMTRRRVQTAAELAEVYHEVGDVGQAESRFTHAVDSAKELENPGQRSAAFTALAVTAARLGRYADLPSLCWEAARTHGASLGEVADTLVVTALRGGPNADRARRALEKVLGSPGLTGLDPVDLLAALTVLNPDTEVEELLLGTPGF
ncbi:hypothetical protein [Streptomyces sp. bgisy082]|uniref:hypothetical protein n=1 Tax=Streptomyces sp. bgisy082 TaxID=3413776 RepID=UPI003D744667